MVLLKSVRELVDGGRNFKSLKENSLLSLDSHISWPFHKSSQVDFMLDISSNSVVSWGLLDQVAGC